VDIEFGGVVGPGALEDGQFGERHLVGGRDKDGTAVGVGQRGGEQGEPAFHEANLQAISDTGN
jgi:hypothetical protein